MHKLQMSDQFSEIFSENMTNKVQTMTPVLDY